MRCKICGKKIKLNKDYTYMVRVTEEVFSFFKSPRVFDAIDCPKCGTQNLLCVREKRYKDETASKLLDKIQNRFNDWALSVSPIESAEDLPKEYTSYDMDMMVYKTVKEGKDIIGEYISELEKSPNQRLKEELEKMQ